VTGRGVIFEHTILGERAKVTAVDEETGIEVVTLGPATVSRRDLEKLALRKLERRLAAQPVPPGEPGKRGTLA
jgi:hypothetical protein